MNKLKIITIFLVIVQPLVANAGNQIFSKQDVSLKKFLEQEDKIQKLNMHHPVNKKAFSGMSKNKTKQQHVIDKQAEEFEEMFLAEMLKLMHSNINPNPLMGGGKAEKTFQEMLNAERAKTIDLGIATMIKQQLEKEIAVKDDVRHR